MGDSVGAYYASKAGIPYHSHDRVPEKKRKVVVLCGSTRFREEFERANREETLAGNIVLSVGHYPHENATRPEVKAELDKLHLEKIDMADEVLILNVGGYIGESTRNELNYAKSLGKFVRFLTPIDREDITFPPGNQCAGLRPNAPGESPGGKWADDVILMHDKFFGDVQQMVSTWSPAMRYRLLEFRKMFITEECTELKKAKTPFPRTISSFV